MRITRYLIAAFVLCGVLANAQAKRFSDYEADTVRGHLSIERKGDNSQFEVKLEDEVIFTSGPQDGVVIEAAYPKEDEPELLLLNLFSGNACEGFFRVVDLRVMPVMVSEQFGNCYYLVPPEEWKPGNLEENPTYLSGVWRIAVPSSAGPMTELTWYHYEDGKIHVSYKGELLNLAQYHEAKTQEILNHIPPPENDHDEFCIAKDSVEPESPTDKMINDTLSWIRGDGFEEVARADIIWKHADYNHDGKNDLYVYFEHNGSMGDYGSAYLSSPVGNKCPANSWCYAGTGFSVFIDKGYTIPKCEEEYAEFTLPD